MLFKYEPYEGNEPYVFISYCRQDKELCNQMITMLGNNSINTWYDKGIHIGDIWPNVIASHLEHSSVCILLVTNGFVESVNCNNELVFSHKHGIPTIPILVGGTNISVGMELMLSSVQYIKIIQDDYSTLSNLLSLPLIMSCKSSFPISPADKKSLPLAIVDWTNLNAYVSAEEGLSVVINNDHFQVERGTVEHSCVQLLSEDEKAYLLSGDSMLFLDDAIINAGDTKPLVSEYTNLEVCSRKFTVLYGSTAKQFVDKSRMAALYCENTNETMLIINKQLKLGKEYVWLKGTLDDDYIDGLNSTIDENESEYTVTDTGKDGGGSLNGTILNRSFIEPMKKYKLQDGDRLQLGRTVLRFCIIPIHSL